MYQKDFDSWHAVKKRIEAEEQKVYIRTGEIRWIAFGVNIGSELDGKGDSFTRPGLIIHVIGSRLALVVPMSTKKKDIPGYVSFEWRGHITALCIHQLRIISQKRVLSRKGRISDNRLKHIKAEIKQFFSF